MSDNVDNISQRRIVTEENVLRLMENQKILRSLYEEQEKSIVMILNKLNSLEIQLTSFTQQLQNAVVQMHLMKSGTGPTQGK